MTILRNMKIGSQTKAYIFLIITLIIFFSPFFIYGKFTVLPIIDNLDCYYVWNKIVAQPVYVFTGPSTNIQEFMNGLPKFTLLNSFTIFYLLNIFFSSFYAVALHIFLIHLVACFSMYLLVKPFNFIEEGNDSANSTSGNAKNGIRASSDAAIDARSDLTSKSSGR